MVMKVSGNVLFIVVAVFVLFIMSAVVAFAWTNRSAANIASQLLGLLPIIVAGLAALFKVENNKATVNDIQSKVNGTMTVLATELGKVATTDNSGATAALEKFDKLGLTSEVADGATSGSN